MPGLPAAQIQLVDAYLYDLALDRREAHEGDPLDAPTLQIELRAINRSPDGNGLAVILQATVVGAFNDKLAIATLRVATAGIFRIDKAEGVNLAEFAMREGVLLTYPYLRGMVGETWRMTEIRWPPIPTLDTIGAVKVLDGVLDAIREDVARTGVVQVVAKGRSRKARKAVAKGPA